MMKGKTILVVDDEPKSRQGFKRILEGWASGQHRIVDADNGLAALDIVRRETVDLLISDIRMPEVSGLQLLESLNELVLEQQPVSLLISGYADFQYAQRALRLGAVNYLLKPVSKAKLIEAVEQALEIREQRVRTERMEKLVDPVLLDLENQRPMVSDAVGKAVAFIDEHLAESFSLADVAGQIPVNPSYLSVLFKEQMNVTFSEYVTRTRMQKAKKLLLTSGLSVNEIAERVGYRTAKYFIRQFKEYAGTSPGQFRANVIKERTQADGRTSVND